MALHHVNSERLRAAIAGLASFGGRTDGGVSRQTLTDADLQARRWLVMLLRRCSSGWVIIVQGRAVVSCESKATCEGAEQETATLSATAKVGLWRRRVSCSRPTWAKWSSRTSSIHKRASEDFFWTRPFTLRIVETLSDARMHSVSSQNPD